MRWLVALLGAGAVSAQLLTKGTSQLPSCAAGCTLLNQAVDACSGQSTVTLATWSCFCQSGYLKPLYQSPNGICDTACTSASDNQAIMSWYIAQCGKDYGQSEHGDAASGSGNTGNSGNADPANTPSAPQSTPTDSSSGSSSNSVGAANSQSGSPSWFSSHWKWVVMLIVLFFGLIAFALGLTWLKRRHERKRDTTTDGFNSGITNRVVPTHHPDNSFVKEPIVPAPEAQDSAARTREAFMPYGYGYTRGDSRAASQTNLSITTDSRRVSNLRNETTIGHADGDAIQPMRPISQASQQQRRVHVRERSLSQLNEKA